MLTAVVGINWGDEGKGRMVDLLSARTDVVIRYQGGNNAGHTVVNDRGKFVLNLLPSGILRDETVNVMGPGMVIDLAHLNGEIASLREKGIKIDPTHLVISDRATICLPFHPLLDGLEEDRMGAKKQGSTRRGIGPAYSDRYMRRDLRMGELLTPGTLPEKVRDLVGWKNLTVAGGYGHEPIDPDAVLEWLRVYGEPLVPYIRDTTRFLLQAASEGKDMMFEAQLGALRDIDFGIHPYTSSSSVLAAYAPIGAGIPQKRVDRVVGIMKAYSSCVGGGPFTCELSGEEAERLREAGGEYGAATGRPRRVGGFDMVASRYGVLLQGATELALTKLDVLSYLDEIPVCTAYEVNGERRYNFPSGDDLLAAKPVYEYMDGWKCDISRCRSFGELPETCQRYVKTLEAAVRCPIRYVSVGAGRDEYFER